MSQDELAAKIGATVRTVSRWETGQSTRIRALYARALEAVTGLPIEQLGFPPDAQAVVVDDGRGGHDLEVRARDTATGPARHGAYTGIWLSRYEYFSSGRSDAFTQYHHVVLLQHGSQLSVRSLPGSADSTMTMDLTVDGSVVTGVWMEQTNPGGYYRGARYHGAIQMLADPTGRRISGKWVGFGKDGDVNTGPWTLTFLDASTSKAAIAQYDRPPGQPE
jgi:transcriptional regulator with XRE-family HTH domain